MISDTARQEMVEMANAGIAPDDIAAQLEVSVASVRKILGKDAGLPEDEIVAAYVRGDKMFEICEGFGVTPPTVYNVLRKQQVALRGQGNSGGDRAALLDAAIEMYQRGDRILDIMSETGLSTLKLYGELQRRGLPKRRVG